MCCIILLFHFSLAIFIKYTISFSILFQQIKNLYSSLSLLQTIESKTRAAHAVFVVNKVALGQISLRVLWLSRCQYHSTHVPYPI
jgi:hypothetical protein